MRNGKNLTKEISRYGSSKKFEHEIKIMIKFLNNFFD
jgi:hypothetical protein